MADSGRLSSQEKSKDLVVAIIWALNSPYDPVVARLLGSANGKRPFSIDRSKLPTNLARSPPEETGQTSAIGRRISPPISFIHPNRLIVHSAFPYHCTLAAASTFPTMPTETPVLRLASFGVVRRPALAACPIGPGRATNDSLCWCATSYTYV
jgi:hypothetical protein